MQETMRKGDRLTEQHRTAALLSARGRRTIPRWLFPRPSETASCHRPQEPLVLAHAGMF